MEEVYRARDTKLGTEVAIRVLPGKFARAVREKRKPCDYQVTETPTPLLVRESIGNTETFTDGVAGGDLT